jgi:hypoxanthine phosphoribosyltransferase
MKAKSKKSFEPDCSSYLYEAFADLPNIVSAVANKIKQSGVKYDAIAFRGVSGLLVGPSVAIALGVPFIVVRKEGENSHASFNIERGLPIGLVNDYIIIDDLISSGDTVKEINSQLVALKKSSPPFQNKVEGMNLSGIFLYARSINTTFKVGENDVKVFGCGNKK